LVLPGLACSVFFPLCISLSGQAFPQFAAETAGALVAIYQSGYGVAAFGVGPLREFAGFPFRTIYSLGSLVAALMLSITIAAVVRVVERNRYGSARNQNSGWMRARRATNVFVERPSLARPTASKPLIASPRNSAVARQNW